MKEISNLEAVAIMQKDYSHLFDKWIENGHTLHKIKNYFDTYGYENRVGYSKDFRMTVAQRINLSTKKINVIGYSFKEVKLKIIEDSYSFGTSLSARNCLELMQTYKRIWDDTDICVNRYHSEDAKYIQ